VGAKSISLPKLYSGGPKVYPFQYCRYSINTEGALLHSKLKTKAYLRITMGKGRGESPGIPYVLEIWPKGRVKIIVMVIIVVSFWGLVISDSPLK
jgi:hypothetical protein